MPSLLDDQLELTPLGRRLVWFLVAVWVCFVVSICFMPQPDLPFVEGVETPNVIYWGRLRFLLVPLNSLWGLGQVDSLLAGVWIILQNLLNVFLLYPLMLGLIGLFPNLRHPQKSLLLAFCFSLGIEVTQLVLDHFFDVNRVFEIDDLWTNSLGGLLAYWTYRGLMKWFRIRYQ